MVILPTDELGTLTMVYRAALVAMMAGAHMIQPTFGNDQNDQNANFAYTKPHIKTSLPFVKMAPNVLI